MPDPLTDAQWAEVRRSAALYPSLASALELVSEALSFTDYGDIESAVDTAAKALYGLPDEHALSGFPEE